MKNFLSTLGFCFSLALPAGADQAQKEEARSLFDGNVPRRAGT